MIRSASTGTSSADGAIYYYIRKSGTSWKGCCQKTTTNAAVLETVTRSGTTLKAGTYGCFSGSYFAVMWDN